MISVLAILLLKIHLVIVTKHSLLTKYYVLVVSVDRIRLYDLWAFGRDEGTRLAIFRHLIAFHCDNVFIFSHIYILTFIRSHTWTWSRIMMRMASLHQ